MTKVLAILTSVFFVASFAAIGQEKSIPVKPLKKVDSTETQFKFLPPLDVIIDSALKNSPMLKLQDGQIEIRQIELARKRKQWLEYLNVEAYGQYTNNTGITSSTFNSGVYTDLNSNSFQWRYGGGVTFKYPIFNLFSRGKDIKMAKKEISVASLQREVLIRDLRKTIIELYNQALLQHSLLEVKIGALETSSVAVRLGELDFRNSKINVSDLSKIADAHMKNQTEYEQALAALRLSLEMLQELSGYYFLPN